MFMILVLLFATRSQISREESLIGLPIAFLPTAPYSYQNLTAFSNLHSLLTHGLWERVNDLFSIAWELSLGG